MKKLVILFALALAACSKLSSVPIVGGVLSGIAAPSPGQWVCYHCVGMSLNGGSFAFPGSNGAVGYIYTGANGNLSGKTITMTYTVSGSGTVVPSPASGQGQAEVRLFLWRKGDDVQCTTTTEWFRQWATWGTTGSGPLTDGTYTISMPITDPGWTDCLGQSDAGQLAATASNLVGVGFTFGASAFGHGVFSTGQNTFTLNSFTVQ